MIAFLVRRIFFAVPLLLGVTLMVFLIMTMAPGDFLDAARHAPDVDPEVVKAQERQFGLDQPWFVQYALWLRSVITLDLGISWAYKIPVGELLAQRIPATLALSLASLLFAWIVAIPLGVLAAIYKDSIFDRVSAFLAFSFISLPEFFLAILAVYVAATTGWLPIGGMTSITSDFQPPFVQFLDYLYHLILPTLVLGLGGIAGTMRILRSNFLDTIRAEFITTARAKGMGEFRVMFVHALRNAINPLISSLGFAFASLLSGALLVENIMNYPGLGQLAFQALLMQDQYVVMAAVLMGSVMLLIGNTLADIALALFDPRIKIEAGANQVRPVHSLVLLIGLAMLYLVAAGLTAWVPWESAAVQSVMSGLRTVSIWVGGLVLGAGLLSVLGLIIWTAIPFLRRVVPLLWHRPVAMICVSVLTLFYLGALLAPFLAPYPPDRPNLAKAFHPPTALVWKDGKLQARVYQNIDPSSARFVPDGDRTVPIRFFAKGTEYRLLGLIPTRLRLFQIESDNPDDRIYLLGADATGRDIFSRLLYGSQVSLSIGLIGITITMILGFLVGGLAGYFGGAVDFICMRLVEFLMAIPGLYLLLSLRSALAPYFDPAQMFLVITIILSTIGWAGSARIIRGLSLSLSQRAFVDASRALGQHPLKILVRHFLPNLASYLIVAATLSIPGYILGEAALSFLGLGIQEPAASWGLMLRQSQEDMRVFMLNFWWLLTPGVAIFATVISFNLLGDTLRDIVDPKFRMNQK